MTERSEELIGDAMVLLHEHGYVPRILENGKHIKIRWLAGGRLFTLVVSRSPSDRRARRQSRAMLKRILRNAKQNGSSR